MALFRKKTTDNASTDAPPEESGKAKGGDAFQPDPEKARKWFEHARIKADTSDHGAALYYFANGIKLDPETMSAHEAMYESAVKYMNAGGKPAASKDVKKLVDGQAVSRFAAAEYEWMKDLRNPALALKMLEAAVKAELLEPANFFARRIFGLVTQQKKLKKGTLLAAKDLFAQAGAWDEAIACGERALQLDPSDNDLATELKDFAAQRAMDQGGYAEETGEGGYRKFIKDEQRQRELEEAESISGGASIEERNLARAEAAYEAEPGVPDNVNLYAQLLRKKATPEAEKRAYQVYMKGFKDTGEYRFKRHAADIMIAQNARRLKALAERLEQGDESVRAKHDELRAELLAYRAAEYAERVERYPTDRQLKFDLGLVELERGRYNEAMAQFQAAKDEPKLAARAGHLLGRCFAAEGWHNDAIAEYKETLEKLDAASRDLELDVRYDLMVSLIEHGRAEGAVELVKEARDICSAIARKSITYRDIRARRKEIDELIKGMSGPGTAE